VRTLQFPSAFVAALCAHGAIALLLALVVKGRATKPVTDAPQELVVLAEEALVPLDQEPAPSAEPPEARVTPAALGRSLPERPAAKSPAPVDLAPPPADAVVAVPAGSAASWTYSAPAPVDLGVNGYWKSVALAGSAEAAAPSAAPEPAPGRPDRRLLETLNARDNALGLGRGGPLVAAAHEAASLAIAPDTGSATFDVEADEAGRIMTANVVSTNGNGPAWTEVARELVHLMSSKRLRLRPGTHGLRTRLRIVAARTLPSGEQTTTNTGAVPDDIPGGDKSCEGEGLERKCLAGSPVGVTRSFGDVANIGARATRIVHAQILGETTL
jgi:hypothetical protein